MTILFPYYIKTEYKFNEEWKGNSEKVKVMLKNSQNRAEMMTEKSKSLLRLIMKEKQDTLFEKTLLLYLLLYIFNI